MVLEEEVIATKQSLEVQEKELQPYSPKNRIITFLISASSKFRDQDHSILACNPSMVNAWDVIPNSSKKEVKTQGVENYKANARKYSLTITPDGRNFLKQMKEEGQGNKRLTRRGQLRVPGALNRASRYLNFIEREFLDSGGDSHVEIARDARNDEFKSRGERHITRLMGFLDKTFGQWIPNSLRRQDKIPKAVIKWLGQGSNKESNTQEGSSSLSGNDTLELFDTCRHAFEDAGVRLPQCYASTPDKLYVEFIEGETLYKFLEGVEKETPDLYEKLKGDLVEMSWGIEFEVGNLIRSKLEEYGWKERNEISSFGDSYYDNPNDPTQRLLIQLDFTPKVLDGYPAAAKRFRNWKVSTKDLAEIKQALEKDYDEGYQQLLSKLVCVDPIFAVLSSRWRGPVVKGKDWKPKGKKDQIWHGGE